MPCPFTSWSTFTVVDTGQDSVTVETSPYHPYFYSCHEMICTASVSFVVSTVAIVFYRTLGKSSVPLKTYRPADPINEAV